jgi:hypothetical protein
MTLYNLSCRGKIVCDVTHSINTSTLFLEISLFIDHLAVYSNHAPSKMHALTELQWHGNYGIRAVAYPQYIYIFMNAIYLYIHECSLGVHNAPKEFSTPGKDWLR